MEDESKFGALLQQAMNVYQYKTGRDPAYIAPETSMTLSLVALIVALNDEVQELKKKVGQ